MKKVLLPFIIVFMLLFLPACNSAKANGSEPTTIIWWHTLDPQYDELVKEIVDGFNSSHDKIKVEAEYMGSFNDINEALVTANAAGSGLPGVAVCNTKFIASYAKNGLFEDLSSYIENSGFDTSAIEEGMLKIGTVNGKQIAMPFFNNTHVIYYNKDMAEKYGISIPSDYSELEAFFKEVKAKTGMTPISMQSLDFYYGSLFRNFGVKIIDNNKCDLNSGAAIKVATDIRSWVNAGYLSWLDGSDASSNMKQAFYNGDCFAILHNSTALSVHQKNAGFRVGIAWYPGANGSANADLGGGVIGIPAKNDENIKAAAWEFIRYLCGNDITTKIAMETGYLPIYRNAADNEAAAEYLARNPEYSTVFSNLKNVVPPFIDESASEICKIWQQYMNMIMLDNADVTECLNNAAAEINEVLAGK